MSIEHGYYWLASVFNLNNCPNYVSPLKCLGVMDNVVFLGWLPILTINIQWGSPDIAKANFHLLNCMISYKKNSWSVNLVKRLQTVCSQQIPNLDCPFKQN